MLVSTFATSARKSEPKKMKANPMRSPWGRLMRADCPWRRDHGTRRRTPHASVGATLKRLVQDRGSAGHQGDPGQYPQGVDVKRADSGAQIAKIKARRSRDQHHQRDTRLNQGDVIGEQMRAGGDRGRKNLLGGR